VDTDQLRPQPDVDQAPALSHPVLRRVPPGATASALGDGMSAVAIAWLALRLAPENSRGLWVGAAVLGARGTLLASALGTVALGVITTAFLVARRHRSRRQE
jgi:hypothetical protein